MLHVLGRSWVVMLIRPQIEVIPKKVVLIAPLMPMDLQVASPAGFKDRPSWTLHPCNPNPSPGPEPSQRAPPPQRFRV